MKFQPSSRMKEEVIEVSQAVVDIPERISEYFTNCLLVLLTENSPKREHIQWAASQKSVQITTHYKQVLGETTSGSNHNMNLEADDVEGLAVMESWTLASINRLQLVVWFWWHHQRIVESPAGYRRLPGPFVPFFWWLLQAEQDCGLHSHKTWIIFFWCARWWNRKFSRQNSSNCVRPPCQDGP